MLRGFYTAGSGMITYQNRLNVHGNNLANVSTAGFKKDGLIAGTFGEHVAVRMNAYQGTNAAEIGRGVFITTTVDEFTDHSQGAFDSTGRSLDLSVVGPGYFVLNNAQGQFLTRDGQFALDDEGYLVLPGYGRVQGESGDIELGTSAFLVSSDGTISVEDEDGELEEVDRFFIAMPAEGSEIKKMHNGELFAVDAFVQLEADEDTEPTRVLQGILERSNVDVAHEMSAIIATQRGFQSCSQILKMYDEMADQANTRITRV